MPSQEKLQEARILADQILALTDTEAARVFHDEMKRRKLAKLVRSLDALVLEGGEDRRLGTLALARLGFPTVSH